MSSTDNFPSQLRIPKPQSEEAAAYYFTYINEAQGQDALETLQKQYFSALNFYKELPTEKWDYRYAEGKWSIKEVLQHITDSERVFAYRALRIGRQDKTPLPGFDQDQYVEASGAADRSPISLLEEYKTVRLATYSLFENMSEGQLTNIGMASEASVSCRALAWIIAGHEHHHLQVIADRYLSK